MKEEKKKKSDNKKGSGCAGSMAFVAAFTSVLSAAPSGVKDGRQCSARRNFHPQFRRWQKEREQ